MKSDDNRPAARLACRPDLGIKWPDESSEFVLQIGCPEDNTRNPLFLRMKKTICADCGGTCCLALLVSREPCTRCLGAGYYIESVSWSTS